MTNSNNNVILSVPSGTWRFYDNFTIIFLAFFLPLTFFLHSNDSCITWWARIYLQKATAYLWLVHIRSTAVLCVYQIKTLENCWILLHVHRIEREQRKRAENSAKLQLTFGMLVKVAVDLVNSWWIQRTVWIRVFKQGNNILTHSKCLMKFDFYRAIGKKKRKRHVKNGYILRWYSCIKSKTLWYLVIQSLMRVKFEKQVIWRLLPIGNMFTSSMMICSWCVMARHTVDTCFLSCEMMIFVSRTHLHESSSWWSYHFQKKKVTDRILIASFST